MQELTQATTPGKWSTFILKLPLIICTHLSQHLQQIPFLELLPKAGMNAQRDVAFLQLQVQVLAALQCTGQS